MGMLNFGLGTVGFINQIAVKEQTAIGLYLQVQQLSLCGIHVQVFENDIDSMNKAY